MKISIIGTRGIPNKYGGFEQFAEFLSVGLQNRGYEVTVYNAHFHPFKENNFKGVKIISKYSPENIIGSSANFIYDYYSLRDSIKKGADIVLACGYQSTAISFYLCSPQKTIIVTNMDGMEWRRAKWNGVVKKLTKWFEKVAVKKSHYLVSDNIGIQQYFKKEYGVDSEFIPYGAEIIGTPEADTLKNYDLKQSEYYLLIARLEPENNIEMILDGYRAANHTEPLIVVGNNLHKYGTYLRERYSTTPGIRFIGGIYKKDHLDTLRFYSKIYFHGHSVGGTNPSLLEAMAASSFIAAHNNAFNLSVLGQEAVYFESSEDITKILKQFDDHERKKAIFIEKNRSKILSLYSWEKIIGDYESFFNKIAKEK